MVSAGFTSIHGQSHVATLRDLPCCRRGLRQPFTSSRESFRYRRQHEWKCCYNETYTREESKSTSNAFFVAAAAAIITASTPLMAHAVSGGGGDLQGAAFADFTGGDFSGKKYYKANFKGTNFTNANLEGTNMFGAYAKGAIFKGDHS
eukprot:jgi/Botrbrau1/18759/Bobra.0386s0082.1